MEAKVRDFGKLPAGASVEEVEIASSVGARARIISYGAAVRELVIPVGGKLRSVVLGLNSAEDYARHSRHFGATAGRFANRIRGGRFTLDGREVQLDRNLDGRHSIHGGATGFGKRVWTRTKLTADTATYALVSPDGDNGYPGALHATTTYRMDEPATLTVLMAATTDAPTVLNLAHHSYFNLMGAGDVLDHEVEIASNFYTPADHENLPTGEIRAVAGTPYDFHARRKIRFEVDGSQVRYDQNHVLNRRDRGFSRSLMHAATVWAPDGSLKMETWTNEAAIQFYDGAKLDCQVPGLAGQLYKAHAGLCLEPQRYPDSPNFSHFTPCVLRPGENYLQHTQYRFIAA